MNRIQTIIAGALGGIVAGAGMTACSNPPMPAADPSASGMKATDAMPSAKHGCKGQNDCKGQGGCKTDTHACKGQNECKGQGGCHG